MVLCSHVSLTFFLLIMEFVLVSSSEMPSFPIEQEMTGNKFRAVSRGVPPAPEPTTAPDYPPTWDESQNCFDKRISWAARAKYSRRDTRFYAAMRDTLAGQYFLTYETIKTVGGGEIYTACDGIARYRSTPGGITSIVTSTVTATSNRAYTSVPPEYRTELDLFLKHSPKCEMNTDFCKAQQERFLSNSTSFEEAEDFIINHLRDSCKSMRYCYLNFSEEVVILYWPPMITSRDICANDGRGTGFTIPTTPYQTVITTSAITFKGADLYLREMSWEHGTTQTVLESATQYVTPYVLTGPFTLTWPTAYVAHYPILADILLDDGTKARGENWISKSQLLPAGLIPLHTTDIGSIRPSFHNPQPTGLAFARAVAAGEYAPAAADLDAADREVLPFDFGDLQNPVPASVYFEARSSDCWYKQTHCATITDDSYRPVLALRNKIWRDQGLGDCAKVQLVDPPIALSEITGELEKPTLRMTKASSATMALVEGQDAPSSRTERNGWPQETGTSGSSTSRDGNRAGLASKTGSLKGSAERPLERLQSWSSISVILFALLLNYFTTS